MLFDDSGPSIGNDIFAHHGRQIILDTLAAAAPQVPGGRPRPEIPSLDVFADIELATTNFLNRANSLPAKQLERPVGILGAGACGLYTALILSDLDIPFEVIEARDRKRLGGRLYTHKFPNSTGAPYNYFEVGAMRFPEHISMRRVFHLFDYPPLNRAGIALSSKKKPYYIRAANNNAFLSYNGITRRQNDDLSGDPFSAWATIFDVWNPYPYLDAGPSAIVNDVIEPFAKDLYDDLKNNTKTGWMKLMKFEHHSARSYMSTQYCPSKHLSLPDEPLSNDVVNWLQTFKGSTGAYERSFSEMVVDAIAFGWTPSSKPTEPAPKETKWFYIDGGASEITEAMYTYLQRRHMGAFKFNHRATSIHSHFAGSASHMEVTTDHGNKREYSHVISTIPLPVMRTIDTSHAGLFPMQASALRQLNYGPAVKIGMQFRTAWWTTATNRKGEKLNIVGGQSFTDTPLRTVVYPSFGDVAAGKTTTLIASYCWTDDAEKLAALCHSTEESDKEMLREMVLRELAAIHDLDIQFLREELIDTFAWSWSLDPYAMGAFAFFGPGKFKNLYQSLTLPAADGHLHFAGEAVSPRHAWVEGAFDSAWRAVFGLLLQPGFTKDQRRRFFMNWGTNAEWWEPEDTEIPIPKEGRGLNLDKLLRKSLLVKHLATAEAGGY